MDEAQKALGFLRDQVAVDLVGRPGSGRTRTVERVVAALEDEDRRVLVLRGVRAQRTRPLGAVLTATKGPPPRRYASVRELAATLEREIRPGSVVVVDDADDLDPVTVGVLGQVHVATRVPMLLTRRLPAEPSGDVRSLVTSLQPGVQLTMAPLRFDGVHRLLHEMLRARLDPLTVARIATKSGGLPGLVRAMVVVGRQGGAIERVGGVWTATRGLWAPELAHAVGDLLARTDREDVAALATLAESGVVDLDTAMHLVRPAHLAELHRSGLVEVLAAPDGGQVSLFPPLLGEYLTHEQFCPQRLERARAVPRDEASPSDDPIMSRILTEHGIHEVAARRAAWRAAPVSATAAALLVALLTVGGPSDEVDEVYAGTDPRSGSAAERAELAGWYAVALAARHGSVEPAVRVLDALRRAQPEAAGYADAVEDHLRIVLDRVPEPAPAPRGSRVDGLGAGDLGDQARDGVLVEVALSRGRIREAERRIAAAAPDHPTFRSHHAVCHGLSAVLAGRVDEGVRWALDHLAAARRDRAPGAIVGHAYVAGLGLAAAGRLAELDAVLSSTLTLTTVPVLQEHFHGGVLTLAGFSAMWQGQDPLRHLLAHGTQPRDLYSGPFPAMHAGGVLTAEGPPAALLAALADRFDRGYVASGVVATAEVADRLGPGVAELDLRGRTHEVDSPLLDAMVRYAEAVAERDAAGLDEAAGAFEALGARLYGVRARVARAIVLREDGDLVASLAEADDAWTTARGFGTAVDGLFAPFVAAVDLSVRELEVVELHAAGLSTADIAVALTVSPRTVESHFSSAYRKLGLDSRDGLDRVASTWLASALSGDRHP